MTWSDLSSHVIRVEHMIPENYYATAHYGIRANTITSKPEWIGYTCLLASAGVSRAAGRMGRREEGPRGRDLDPIHTTLNPIEGAGVSQTYICR